MKSTCTLRTLFLPAIALLLTFAIPGRAALQVEVLDTVKIHESRRYGFFPSLQMLATGELICDFSLDADSFEVEANFWGFVISRDRGKTWGMRNTGGMVYREAAYTRSPALPDGSLLMVAGYPLPGPGDDYRNLETVSVRLSDGGNTSLFRRDVRIHLPQAARKQQQVDNRHSLGVGTVKETAGMVFCGDITAARDGGWLTTMYGNFADDKFYRTIVVKSDAAGKDWTYVSTIASDANAGGISDPADARTYEGPCEPRMIRLGDGRLLAVMRLGGSNLMCKSWSEDDGLTWSPPVSMGFRGVKPALLALQSGLVACSTGRPDAIAIRFSADGGKTWSEPTALTRDAAVEQPGAKPARQKSTCYTGMVEVEPGRLLVVYDHLPFVEGWGLNPETETSAMNTIYGTFVQVRN